MVSCLHSSLPQTITFADTIKAKRDVIQRDWNANYSSGEQRMKRVSRLNEDLSKGVEYLVERERATNEADQRMKIKRG